MHPHQHFWPQVPPPRRARRTVAVVTAAVLGCGLIGGTTGAVIAGAGSPVSPAPITATAAADTGPLDVSAVVEEVMPSVVEVNVRSGGAEGLGSGVILSADGRILTNYHVVSGAREIQITFSDGTTAPAELVGSDPAADLALLRAEGVSGLTPAVLGDSGAVAVGDAVIAIGSPAGLQGTVTTGIVSALDRDVTISSGRDGVAYRALQTDASINQGNSGGPLFDTAGRVIGINSAIYSPVSGPGGSAGSVGIGFSIPVDTAKAVIARMG